MDQATPRSIRVIRTLAALAAVFALLNLAGSRDWLSDFTRPFVVGCLNLAGIAATNLAGELVIGRLHVPWTRDCAGLNILTMLWAITLWVNRAEPISRRFWLRLAMGLPAAYLANIARIFTLIAYRHAFYPNVESPQLHYFIGFLWVMPCLPFFVPRAGREFSRYLLETLFLVTALSLVSPYVQAPGGSLVTLAVLLLVAKSRFTRTLAPGHWYLAAVWVAAAGFIALANMESLWLPWLLLCPWFVPAGFQRAYASWVLVLATIPLVAMHPFARWLVALAALVEVWGLLRSDSNLHSTEPSHSPKNRASGILVPGGLILLFLTPFVASTLGGLLRPNLRPPPGVMARELASETFELRLVGQPGNINLVWYGPSGDGRHHTLSVCMRYRGVVLQPSGAIPSVLTDGNMWMREFFLQRGRLLTDYRAYIQNTFLPWTSAGVHVIASATTDSMSPEAFDSSILDLAMQLSQLDASAQSLLQPHSLKRNLEEVRNEHDR